MVFFVLGCICGKKTRTTGDTTCSGTEMTPPVQLHVQSDMIGEQDIEQDIELNENVAYGPVYH